MKVAPLSESVNVPSNGYEDDKEAETDGHDDTADEKDKVAVTIVTLNALATRTGWAIGRVAATFTAGATATGTTLALTCWTSISFIHPPLTHPEQHRPDHKPPT
ncbi:amino acid transporter [Babesia caballi]|uniref:Amino acid transporter n=1 Tax=Babesia caballi TaxID=5871 RepID=A0AAV4LSH4_BABCB|nr:amino acid transporter [Babesia caballi]